MSRPPRAALAACWMVVLLSCAPAPRVTERLPSTFPIGGVAGVSPSASRPVPPLPPRKVEQQPAPEHRLKSEAMSAPRPCGQLGCLAFATPIAAFDYVLLTKPRVLALGEAHALASTPGIASSTRRFAEQLLPRLSGKARHIVIELLLAQCAPETVRAVEQRAAPVTKPQAKSNQNEFVALGKIAQRLGIEPEGLTPDCAHYNAVVAAGADGVAGLLSLIAEQTAKQVEVLLQGAPATGEPIVTYGGALHNDLYPRPGQEAWSFGPKLAQASDHRYVELDLIVPEFIKDNDAWRSLPWFAAFDRNQVGSETLLLSPAPGSFVLIFPKTEHSPAEQR